MPAAQDAPDAPDAKDASHYRICPLCEACCGLEVRTRGSQVLGIRGAEYDVFSAGYLCPKAVALRDLHEDPDRIRTPLIRRGARFLPATWDEAFAEIERRLPPLLQQHGRDAVAVAVGNPSAHKMGLLLYFSRLAKALGTKNVFSASTLDQMPKQLSSGWMFGHWLSIPVPDIARSHYLLVIGANPMASNGSLWTVPDFRGKARALRERGGRLVVIDPRRTETAAVADAHHFIRPGADIFLLAAMVHTLFDEGLVRTGRLAEHLNGVDDLRQAMQAFAPERVAARCAIDALTIRQLARELAAAESGCVYGRLGTCTQSYGTLCSWLVDVLNALTGKLDEPGGAMFPQAAAFAQNTQGAPGRGRGVATGRHASRVSGAPEIYGELPMTCLSEEIETPGPGQVRALFTVASNPVLSSPGGPRLARALDELDFMVSMDLYINETTRHADVILPGQSPLEHSHYDVAFPQLSWRNHARFSEAVFAPAAGHLPEWQQLLRLAAIAKGLGARADVLALDDEAVALEVRKLAGDQAPWVMQALAGLQGPERLLELALRSGPYGDAFGMKPGGLSLAKVRAAAGGIDLGELAPRVPELLRTPSGKVELAPAQLLADLPRALADLDTPAPALVVIGRRDVRSNNSWMHNLPTLAKGPFRGTALVHPQDAARQGLADGARARLASAQGSVEVTVALSDSVMPGVISLPHGWGHDLPGAQLGVAARQPGANLNALLDDAERDPLSGNAVLSGVAVTLAPA
ncbi:MAG: molybdopterin-dependent oxidoreductase [Rubrivivax sp.]|nr:molybdopterin-dependent oxidoreductase [Rubrivivax sp.]